MKIHTSGEIRGHLTNGGPLSGMPGPPLRSRLTPQGWIMLAFAGEGARLQSPRTFGNHMAGDLGQHRSVKLRQGQNRGGGQCRTEAENRAQS